MSFKFLSRFKQNKKKESYENVVCANCETKFSGNFCPNCGQAIKEYDKPFGFIFYNFLGDFFAFDMRFFRTLGALLFKPGYLSKEYIEGRRVKFAPPFRIFVFVSFVLFLMLQNYTNRGLTTVLDAEMNSDVKSVDSLIGVSSDSLSHAIAEEMTPEELAQTDSLLREYGMADTSVADSNINLNLNLGSFRDTKDLRHGLAKLAVGLEEKLEKEEDPEQRVVIREHIRLCRSPEQAMAKILEYISWAFFLLLPLFALLLKLFYIRRKQNYMRHLIFSIHMHAFIYSIMIIIIGLYMSFDANLEAVTAILILTLPIYTIVAMKRFYKQSVRKTIVKFFLISFMYNIVYVLLIAGAIANALEII